MFIDSIGFGGAQNQFTSLALLLKEKGYHVTILVVYDEFNFYKDKIENIDIICDKKSRKALCRIFRLPLIIKRQDPDAVIAYLDSQNIIACISRFFFKFRLIVSERNTTQRLDKREKFKFWLYQLADFIVPNSYAQGKFIVNNYPRYNEKLRVITNVIDSHRFYPQYKNVNREEKRILSVGRLNEQKNYLSMVDVVKLLRDKGIKVHFGWYAAVDSSEYASKVIGKIKKYNLEDVITIYEPVSTIEDIYRENDIFWLASKYEGFPNVLCEAMACGLPVACSNVCDNPIIVKEGINGVLFPPDNIEIMVNQIEKLINMSDDSLKKISQNNIKRIKDLCSEKVFVNKYIELIES